jgi:2-iminoacetate synthase ThiH
VRVEHDLIQRRGFWFTLLVVLELFLLALPCVSPKHMHEEIVLTGAKVVWASCVIGGEGFRGRSQRDFPAGSHSPDALDTNEIRHLIEAAGLIPQERTTTYKEVHRPAA